ncbi:hypothetical protein [Prescottella equi]|uniref:hypothetical protein n=1 Tax=Rhodococcus hoagii TaxID=43767 RepID=UPI000AD64060|nr:hypothetical protein [Prescottella equi]
MKKEHMIDAVDQEAVRLLETDPAKFFDSPRRIPFGFVSSKSSSSGDTTSSES